MRRERLVFAQQSDTTLTGNVEQGYDAVHIATATGLDTVASDISETAIKEARE